MPRSRKSAFFVGIMAVAGIWIIAFAAVVWVRSLEPTAAEIQEMVERTDLAALGAAERERFIERVVHRLNRLSFEERSELRRSRGLEPLVEQMSEDERRAFLFATLPEGMRQMMHALNAMEPERRRALVDRAMEDLKQTDGEELAAELEKEHVQAIVQVGLEAYFEEASADTKSQLAPLIEHLQMRIQRLR